MGRKRAGPAKICVVGSALFGTISGSAVSNVASVGVFTIPMMKRTGYSARDAGAIEAVGSTGGQLAKMRSEPLSIDLSPFCKSV